MLRRVAQRNQHRRRSGGFTLTEVVVASTLLLLGIIPILKALTGSYVSSDRIDNRTQSLFYAQARLDFVKSMAVADFDRNYTDQNVGIEGRYYCNVSDLGDDDMKQLSVSVGRDVDNDRQLDSEEVLVTLKTQLARRF